MLQGYGQANARDTTGYYITGESPPDGVENTTQEQQVESQEKAGSQAAAEAVQDSATGIAATNIENSTVAAVNSTISTVVSQTSTASGVNEKLLGKQAGELGKVTGNLNKSYSDWQLSKALMQHSLQLQQEGLVSERHQLPFDEYLVEIEQKMGEIRESVNDTKLKHGELASKIELVGKLAKMTGFAGTVSDTLELASRAKTAWETDKDTDWQAVAGQAAKLTTNFVGNYAAVGAGMLAAAIAAPLVSSAVVVTGAATIAGGVANYAIGELSNYIEEQVSKGNNPFDLSSGNGGENTADLVLIGDFDYSGLLPDAVLQAENITLVGNHRFNDVEINSKNLTVIGTLETQGKLIVNSEQTEIVDEKSFFSDIIPQHAGDTQNTESDSAVAEPEKHGGTDEAQNEEDVSGNGSILDNSGDDIIPFQLDPDVHMRIMEHNATPDDKIHWSEYKDWVIGHENYYVDSGMMTKDAYDNFVHSLSIV